MFYEYKYFKSDADSSRQKMLLKKIDLYLRSGNTGSDVFKEIKRVNVNNLSGSQTDFLWNATLISYLNNESAYAGFFLAEYVVASKDSSISVGLMKILIYKYTDTNITRKTIRELSAKDSLFNHLNCFEDIVNYDRKYLNFYLISSAILPGSGAALNGYVLKGLLSLAIMSASVYGIVKMVEYGLYVNAVLWGTGVGLKFYAGNINLMEKLFYKAEAKHKNKLSNSCEVYLKNILDKHPLILKLK